MTVWSCYCRRCCSAPPPFRLLAVLARCISLGWFLLVAGATQHEQCESQQDGATLSLGCPADSVIEAIEYAYYGVSDGCCWCQGGFRPSPSCNTAGAVVAVRRECVNKNNCSIYVGPASFGGVDPCPGTLKHLSARARCSTIMCGSVPDHSVLPLGRCAPGSTIIVDQAYYGLNSGDCAHGFRPNPTCNIPNATAVVANFCGGNTTCDVPASPSFFNGVDPCAGTEKSLSAKARCSNCTAELERLCNDARRHSYFACGQCAGAHAETLRHAGCSSDEMQLFCRNETCTLELEAACGAARLAGVFACGNCVGAHQPLLDGCTADEVQKWCRNTSRMAAVH